MSERIDAALEGDLPLDDLTAEEREAIARFDARLDKLRGELAAPLPPDLCESVMHRIRAQGLEPLPEVDRPTAVRRVVAWLWAAREIRLQLRPAYGLAVAVLALVLLRPGDAPVVPLQEGTPVAAAPSQRIYVQFRLRAEDATSVALAGSFTSWEPAHPLQRMADGTWTVLLAVPAGVHDYAFVVDGDQ